MHWTLLFSLMVMVLWGSESFPITHHPLSFPLFTSLAARNPFEWSLHSNSKNVDMDQGTPHPGVLLRVQYCGG